MEKYRLVTRSDFDGLVCAVLLKHLGMIDEIKFVHPKDMQDGIIDIGPRDITTNLPYVPTAYLVFDHHSSEMLRNDSLAPNQFIDPEAPSAARVVYDHFGGSVTFPDSWNEMMVAVDKGDSADFTLAEIKHPKGWVLLNYLMDARTGLGRFHNFRVSNYTLMMALIDYCADHSIEEILDLPDVRERVDLFFRYEVDFKAQLERCSRVNGPLVVLDLRDEEVIFPGNRFMIYAMNPACNISIHVLWGLKRQNTVFAVGKSIVNRSSNVDIGALMLEYGGGGHEAAGTCQVANETAAEQLETLIERISSVTPNSQSAAS